MGFQDSVCDYVTINQTPNTFKGNRHGKDWLRNFMFRNNVSTKKANMISTARKAGMSNPFIINNSFHIIEKIIMEKDELEFLKDPTRSKVISVSGEVAYKITWGAGRENNSTLAACYAARRALDPLIVFTGKNF